MYQQEEAVDVPGNLVAHCELKPQHWEEKEPAQRDVHQCLAAPVCRGKEPRDPQLGTSSHLGRHNVKGRLLSVPGWPTAPMGMAPGNKKLTKSCYHCGTGVKFYLFLSFSILCRLQSCSWQYREKRLKLPIIFKSRCGNVAVIPSAYLKSTPFQGIYLVILHVAHCKLRRKTRE